MLCFVIFVAQNCKVWVIWKLLIGCLLYIVRGDKRRKIWAPGLIFSLKIPSPNFQTMCQESWIVEVSLRTIQLESCPEREVQAAKYWEIHQLVLQPSGLKFTIKNAVAYILSKVKVPAARYKWSSQRIKFTVLNVGHISGTLVIIIFLTFFLHCRFICKHSSRLPIT